LDINENDDLKVFRVERWDGKVVKVVIEIYPFQISFIKDEKGKIQKSGVVRLDKVFIFNEDDACAPRAYYKRAVKRAGAIFSGKIKIKRVA